MRPLKKIVESTELVSVDNIDDGDFVENTPEISISKLKKKKKTKTRANQSTDNQQ